jgi:hypothetical protein
MYENRDRHATMRLCCDLRPVCEEIPIMRSAKAMGFAALYPSYGLFPEEWAGGIEAGGEFAERRQSRGAWR